MASIYQYCTIVRLTGKILEGFPFSKKYLLTPHHKIINRYNGKQMPIIWQRCFSFSNQISFFFHIPDSFFGCLHSNLTASERSDFCIPRNETARPRSQFPHSCICEQFIYSHDRSTYFAAAKYWPNDPGNIEIAYRYMNVELGTRPRSFMSGNICFEFSVHCLCSAQHCL